VIFKAIEFSTKAHAGQYRKGTKIPYIIHPLGVAKILIEYGCPDHVVIAGILHDTIEDTTVTFEQIKDIFGSEVADLVKAASEPDKSDTWENRKKHTIGMLKTLSKDAANLILADKLNNIRAIREDLGRSGEGIWGRFNRPKEQQKWYYENLSAVFTDSLTDEQSRNLLDLFKSEVAQVFGDGSQEGNAKITLDKPNAVLTEQDVRNIFKKYIEKEKLVVKIFTITDSLPVNCSSYGLPKQDCWYVLCSAHPSHVYMICSSRVVAISKATGEVVYDGSANDEG
jgi:hypothetical protein